MVVFLTLVSGIAWSVVYLAAIRVGIRDRTFAIPAAAIALNFAWEVIYTVQELTSDFSVQTPVNMAWAVLDAVIVATLLRYGRRELPAAITRGMFTVGIVVLFAVAFVVQGLFVDQFGWAGAVGYSAFLQNLLMSGLFIAMYLARAGRRGQSVVIAVAKWVGTLAPTILLGWLAGSTFIAGIGALCSVLDLAYIALLIRNPLGRAATATTVEESVPASLNSSSRRCAESPGNQPRRFR